MKTKRFISAILALVMVLAMAAPAFAEGDAGETYDITVEIIGEKGCKSYKVEPTEDVVPGTDIVVAGYANEGWKLKSVTKVAKTGVAIQNNNTKYGFYMPESDVTVTFEFVEKDPTVDTYNVYQDEAVEHGTIIATPSEDVEEGTQVSLRYVPDEGYRFVSGSQWVKDADGNEVEMNVRYGFLMPASDAYVYAEFEEIDPTIETYAYLVGKTGSFNDNIKLNFYVYYQEAGQATTMPDDVYAVLTCVDKTVKIRVASVTPNNNGYKLSIDLVAKQIEDDVTLKLVVGEDGAEAFPFRSKDGVENYSKDGKNDSLLDYFTRAIDSETTSDTMKALARAARDYCYAAAQEFGYNWHDQYTFSAAVENVTAATLADYEEVEDGNYPTGVSHKGYSVMFETDNSFRKYVKFTNVENPEEAFTYKVDGKVAPLLKQATRGYYLTFKKVYSDELQKPHTIEISDGTNTYTLSASVLTYCRLVLLSDKTSDAMKTLAKAAYAAEPFRIYR